jgi:hypothetical protein
MDWAVGQTSLPAATRLCESPTHGDGVLPCVVVGTIHEGRLGRGTECRLVMDDTHQSRKLADEILPITEWSPWWIGMWVTIAAALLTSVFFMGIWHWLTLTLFAFGIPEFIGTLKQDDRYPPLTHVIVRYVDREIAFPLLFGFAGAIGAYWFGVPRPQNMGLLVGLIGWLSAHFDRRYEQSDAKK